MRIAKNFTDFTEKAVATIIAELNKEEAQAFVEEMRKVKLEQNPNLTTEEWEKTKQQFVLYIFNRLLEENPTLRNEFAEHLYNKLREVILVERDYKGGIRTLCFDTR